MGSHIQWSPIFMGNCKINSSTKIMDGDLTQEQVDNRLILRDAMTQAGFSPITTEWWHFDSFPYKETKQKFTIIE